MVGDTIRERGAAVPAIEGRVRELIEAKNFAHVGTVREDGTVLVVPVWVHTDGEHVLLNSAEGRAWPANLRRTGTITVTVTNHENPYEFTSITGSLALDTHEGADEHINELSKKYIGQDEYPFRQPGEQRVKFAISPDRVKLHGS
ncbi:TIGR03618 family F420-dependent PPOX class oxidoreductase [Conexibacter sp. W3-3-2]|uniref:PPOX class F420-dependent oxidoreductase n=1 Tax=Paraconexibacter algicola TaxID=2133960 RepID=A0A2T4UDL4_9ACTN|nr:TIGR03618 family F420-dependent PPOX class oxidoreductase [Conexibacter sp. W3-3-2]PTL55600.1 PPOX class F420-dependent oxidoreductase [Paraconexibacter algicola]